jgi:hypothetical protein
MALTTIAASGNSNITINSSRSVLYISTNGAGSATLKAISGCGNFTSVEFSGQRTFSFQSMGVVNISASSGGSCAYEVGIGAGYGEVIGAQLSQDASGNSSGIVAADGSVIPLPIPHRRYHFHGFTGLQMSDDTQFKDISGMKNHAQRGIALSQAQLWAAAGYASTLDPATSFTDSVMRIPSLNFDYAAGEKLILWWLGSATPEGAITTLMGDSSGSFPGVRLRAQVNGKIDLVLYGAGALTRYGSLTTATVLDGTPHSFGFLLDGANKRYGMWVDEVYDSGFGASYAAFSAGQDADTRNSGTFNIGCGAQAAAASLDGLPTKTRGLVVIRLAASDPTPSIADLTTLFNQLRNNGAKVVMQGAI